MSFTLRAAYAKTGLLRMVAHRDMGTHIRRMCQRAALPVSYSQGFNPHPRFRFSPPLPLGATCGEDWIDIDLEEALPGPEVLRALREQTLPGLEWVAGALLTGGEGKIQNLLQYAEWTFLPYQPEEARPLVEAIQRACTGESLPFLKKSKKGKVREIDVRPRILRSEPEGDGLRVVLGASPAAAEGAIGLFDFLRACLPDLGDHPLTVFRICRERFLRKEGEELLPAFEAPATEIPVSPAESLGAGRVAGTGGAP